MVRTKGKEGKESVFLLEHLNRSKKLFHGKPDYEKNKEGTNLVQDTSTNCKEGNKLVRIRKKLPGIIHKRRSPTPHKISRTVSECRH
jgi:hypothetical protein